MLAVQRGLDEVLGILPESTSGSVSLWPWMCSVGSQLSWMDHLAIDLLLLITQVDKGMFLHPAPWAALSCSAHAKYTPAALGPAPNPLQRLRCRTWWCSTTMVLSLAGTHCRPQKHYNEQVQCLVAFLSKPSCPPSKDASVPLEPSKE